MAGEIPSHSLPRSFLRSPAEEDAAAFLSADREEPAPPGILRCHPSGMESVELRQLASTIGWGCSAQRSIFSKDRYTSLSSPREIMYVLFKPSLAVATHTLRAPPPPLQFINYPMAIVAVMLLHRYSPPSSWPHFLGSLVATQFSFHALGIRIAPPPIL